ncbi:hypothetical protein BDP27DRAFT_791580 [Rhodocollybia butyracea]|uniref:Uncharacterized protein n=1 Tax=Rhodocollybia butyracea TaxID=206335 RepID=A0A9P5UFI0_9AGAR|nr:hypothetical protein BDP27DRAFT_791580 [Rhodocollybia butyracea]
MSTSRRSSKSTKSTKTTKSTASTRSARPSTWRVTSSKKHSNEASTAESVPPVPPLIVSKNSSAPEVSMETVAGSSSGPKPGYAEKGTRRERERGYSMAVAEKLARPPNRNKARTRLQDVFNSESEPATATVPFPLTSTSSPALLQSEHVHADFSTPELNLSSATAELALSEPEPDIDITRTEAEATPTIRGSETIHTWFNPFAPSPSRPQQLSTSPSTSPIFPSPLSRTSSHIGSVDDEVPALVKTPVRMSDEGGFSAQQDEAKKFVDKSDSDTQNLQSQTLKPRKRIDSLNSLNPSTSRFGITSISIPLLGRPKKRLEDAVRELGERAPIQGHITKAPPSVQIADSVSSSSTISMTPPIPALTGTTTTTTSDNSSLSAIKEPEPEPEPTFDSKSTLTLTPNSNSKQAQLANPLPIDHPVDHAKSVDSTNLMNAIDVTHPSDTKPSDTAETSQEAQAAQLQTERSNPDQANSTQSNLQQSSWWSYVGWNSSQANPVSETNGPPAQESINDIASGVDVSNQNEARDTLNVIDIERSSSAPPVLEPTSVQVAQSNASTHSTQSTPPNPSSNDAPPSNSNFNNATNTLAAPRATAADVVSLPVPHTENHKYQPHHRIKDEKPPSIFSLDAARAAGSWLSPWTWYGSGSGTGIDNPGTIGTTNAATTDERTEQTEAAAFNANGDIIVGEQEMTESEKIKEAALARDREGGKEKHKHKN